MNVPLTLIGIIFVVVVGVAAWAFIDCVLYKRKMTRHTPIKKIR